VVGAAQRLGDAVDVFGSGHGDARYEALGMVSGVLQGVDAVRDLSNPGVSASLSIGYSASRFEQQSRFDGVAPARIDAGGDLALAAGRDLAVAALQARAGGDLDLYAGRDLAIESALATQSQSLRHSATSAALGLDLGWSVAGGQSLGLSLSANHARGNQSGTAASQVDSDLRAGERLALLTGNDALIAGAQLRGRDILLDIGGDLHVASRADTSRLRGSSFNAGFGLTIGLMPGAGSSLDLSLGGGRERADSSLINQQTAIIADQRLEAYVEGHTQLDGGLIASLNGDLSLDTGTLGFSDIDERARSDSRRATVSLGLGDGGSPSIGVEGELAHEATDAITRATIGEGTITIRDEDAQRAREEAGETREVAALNRDLDMARETLRDERAGVRFYASDSSVRAAVEAVDFIGRTLSEITQEAFRNMDSEGFDQIADALERDALTDEAIIAQLGACRPQHGFNLLHWLISPAHAAVTCRIETNDGQVIHFTREETEQCLELYLAIGERKPSELQRWVEGLTITNAFAEPIGNLHAMQGGPVILGENEEGEAFTAMDAQGRFLYRNAVTGIYFYANPRDSRDTVTVGTATELAGIFTGVSAASRVIARGAGVVRSGVSAETQFTTSSGAVVRPNASPQYTTAFEVQLPMSAFPGVSRQRHNQLSNQALDEAFRANPDFARQMEALYPGILQGVRPGQRGAYPRSSPTPELTWHHGTAPGQMQLVPRSHHQAPGPVQDSLHPGGTGGFSGWGTE